MPGIHKLLICITFFYSEKRLSILRNTCSGLSNLAKEVNVVIITNDPSKTSSIIDKLRDFSLNLKIVCPDLLGHPYLLTWCHQSIFRDAIKEDTNITHFMYIEDDIVINQDNIRYWLEGREALRQAGLIPSFLRYEISGKSPVPYATDITKRINLFLIPKVKIPSKSYCYINLPQPYQGMYLLDRELMIEHLSHGSSNPDFGPWPIREKAAQGITFLNVPRPFTSRNVLGYCINRGAVDERSLIHHAANNYVNDESSSLAKIPVNNIFSKYSLRPKQIWIHLKDQISFMIKGKHRDARSLRRLRRRRA
jgi:hypothetical protein